jgi:hypothetical protein
MHHYSPFLVISTCLLFINIIIVGSNYECVCSCADHLPGPRLSLTLPNPMVINATRISRRVRALPERFSYTPSSRSGQRTCGQLLAPRWNPATLAPVAQLPPWHPSPLPPRWHRGRQVHVRLPIPRGMEDAIAPRASSGSPWPATFIVCNLVLQWKLQLEAANSIVFGEALPNYGEVGVKGLRRMITTKPLTPKVSLGSS